SLFDTLYIVVAVNGAKTPFFSLEERIQLLTEIAQEHQLANVIVAKADGLLVAFARNHGCRVLVRSIRNSHDLMYEQSMASMNRRLDPEIDTIFLPARQELADVSSSAVRELIALGRLPDGIVPQNVRKAIENRRGLLT
ncbi:MAG: pantetheine-phosphate adenylyltransferase, partial [Spirochaetia bacterium]|nr:pantetheine-phosphate adenylyltransferase [Spirochaetia bacterium]